MQEQKAPRAIRAEEHSPKAPSPQSSKKKKKERKRKIIYIFLLIGITVAVAVLLYPSFTDWLARYMQSITISGYNDDYLNLTPEEIEKMKADAIAYNERLYVKQKTKAFAYEGDNYSDKEYDSILRISPIRSTMGYLEVPKINIYLPIAHGTKADDLATQAGHMYGTSVPIGGNNTHAVLAGHTGLRTADLFTNLNKLKVGDEFRIHVLNEIHVYKVDQIKTVLPNQCNQELGIVDDKDYVTLYTCTPYGINSHRLLVRGERTYPDIIVDGTNGDAASINSKHLKALIIMLLLGLIPLLILGVGLYFILRDKEKVRRKKLARKQKKLQKNKPISDIQEDNINHIVEKAESSDIHNPPSTP